MKKEIRASRVWGLLMGLSLCLPADGTCETPCTLGAREISVDYIVPALCASTSTLDSCCATIAQDFRDTWTVLQRIESKADELCSPCNATPITGPYTISNSGIYCLANDCTGPITIATTAPNVTLDLNNHTISGGTNGVVITGDNAWVKNGTVRDTSAHGITITAAGCVLDTLDVLGSPTGFLLQNASATQITNCRALENTFAGFSLIAGTTNNLTNCQAVNQAGTSSVYGFVANSGQGNIFQECQAIGAQTVATGADYIAGGFVLGDTEFFDTIINCKASTIHAGGLAQAYGILAGAVTGPQDIFIANNTSLISIDWSPDGEFFAYADANNTLKVFSFDGTTLTLQDSQTLASAITKIAWQPANTIPYLIAVASGNNTVSTYTFNGTILALANTDSVPQITTLAWSADGDYIAVNGIFSDTPTFAVYDSTLSSSIIAPGSIPSINTISWQPGPTPPYTIAVGTNNAVQTYTFTPPGSISFTGSSFSNIIRSISWSPNGNYLAVAQNDNINEQLSIMSPTLSPITTLQFGTTQLTQVAWASDNTTLALSNQAGEIGIFSFANPTLTLDETKTRGAQVNSVAWPYSGLYTDYLAVGGVQAPDTYVGQIYTVGEAELANHKIINNLTTNVTTASISGVGIKVNSAKNYVAHNTACGNDINYALVNPLFLGSQANALGAVTNIDCSLPNIPEPEVVDFSTTYSMLATVTNENWSIESKAEVISSKIDFIASQYPIEQGTTVRTPLASQLVKQPGSYFLRENIGTAVSPADLTISSSFVTIDLNGFTVQGTIVIDPAVQNVIIKKGSVATTNALASIAIAGIDNANIQLDDLVITGTAYGVFVGTEGLSVASTTTNLLITNCTFSGQTESCITNQTTEMLNPINGLQIANCYCDASSLTPGVNTFFLPRSALYLLANGNPPNTNLEIRDSTFIVDETGCYFEYCENCAIHNCSFKSIDGASDSIATHCNGCNQVVIKNGTAENMSRTGFLLIQSSDITLRECQALGAATSTGFYLSSVNGITLDRCTALSCFDGFSLGLNGGPVNAFTIKNCIASKNSNNGFFSNTIQQGLIKGCKAEGNGNYGFEDVSGGTTVTYVNNISRGNGISGTTNYQPFPGDPFNAASLIDGPLYWQNVVQ
ncbi:hypothetical protein CVU75_01095 [Candidatus Dependentiae bacterium HGW-Dependentiae-1]|nr:MAG: hypothetical protein CVU75_01095 [Candidatus Dependentiae bacterium HGW-Dependentiae-1]